ncbi:MAG: hypothetical protein J5968_06890 [Oscillospiraceae bacterium]|nr:hypothetical protein [Oscillospiraceae bacterium]MBP1557688.1 hypothetical protein [Oscillospiraceae bacterium]
MARKGTKIKRYGSIYGRNSGSVVIAAAMIIGLSLFAVAGWLLYTPIHDFVMNIGSDSPKAPASSIAAPVESQPTSPTAPVTSEAPAPAVTQSEIKGIYIPAQALGDAQTLSATFENAVSAGFNTVLVDAKDAAGTVLYSSDNAIGKMAGVAAESTYDAKAAAEKIKSAGLTPAARLHAFRDPAAAIADRDLAVTYYDTAIYWFDNSPELGGKPWLNPYSDEARRYIVSLAQELCDSGFEMIMLDSVQFPTGFALDKAGYGANSGSITRTQILSQFVNEVRDAVEDKGAELVLCCSTDWLTADEKMNQMVYGGSPAEYFTESVMVAMPQDSDNWGNIISSIGEKTSSGQISLIPVFAADGAVMDNAELINAVEKSGAEEYVFYNPHGSYRFK